MARKIVAKPGGAAVSTATTGVKLSYTCPAAKQARGRCRARTSGTQTVQLRITRSGEAAKVVRQVATASEVNEEVSLAAGDTVDWNCSVLLAASTADLDIEMDEEDI